MAQTKEEKLAKARERVAKSRAAKKAVANQGAEQAPATTEKAEDQVTPEVKTVQPKEDVKTETKVEKPVTTAKSKVIVISPFRDKDNFNKTFSVGDDISYLPEERLKKIIEYKLAEKK